MCAQPHWSGEQPVPAYEVFTSTELLLRLALQRLLAGVSTRGYPVALEPVGRGVDVEARSTSKSAVSRRLVQLTDTSLADLLSLKRCRAGRSWCQVCPVRVSMMRMSRRASQQSRTWARMRSSSR